MITWIARTVDGELQHHPTLVCDICTEPLSIGRGHIAYDPATPGRWFAVCAGACHRQLDAQAGRLPWTMVGDWLAYLTTNTKLEGVLAR